MNQLVLQAYNQSQSKQFHDITIMLEKLLKQRYAASDPRSMITTKRVKQLLDHADLKYIICDSFGKDEV
jgi:hypothetical protein